MTNHEEAGRQVLQNLGDILPQHAQRPAANRTGRGLRFVPLRLTWEMTRQRVTGRWRSGSQRGVSGRKLGIRLTWVVDRVCLQLFQAQLQLLDLAIQFFRLAPKLHTPQLGDEQLQLLDLALVSEQLSMLRKDQRLQSSVIQHIQVGKDGAASSHTLSMPSTPHGKHCAAHQTLDKSHRGT